MDAIAEKVLDGLSSLALEEFNLLRNLRDDKKRMEQTVTLIKAALVDAEGDATSHLDKKWLEMLKDVLYDADDLLDDFSAESLARRVRGGDNLANKVRTFCSKSNQLAYAHVMSRRMKDIRKKFDRIADDKDKLKPDPSSSKPPVGVKERRQTHSFVPDEEVIGREEEKNLLKSILLNTNESKDVSIIAIVGLGGLGKTTLAQFLYNDGDVQNHFELKMWVCVSDQFGLREIGQKMTECEKDANIQQVQEKIRNKIKGRRYILVLDDVWNENCNLWLELKSLLMEGRKGSMIIVTTRIAKVKEIMNANFTLVLEGLDDEKSWKLFSRMAFEEGKEPDSPELIDIGKQIVKKCNGIPLALKTIGSLLHTECNWLYLKNSELLRIDEKNNDMLPILKISYDYLSSNLKNCFSYCSLFPKDYKIERETLIQLWMAQGFIPLSNQGRCPEDEGHEYFMNLLSRSFFQDVESDEFGDIKTCQMHDLMHDLATLISKNECMIVKEENKENIGDRVRHLSYDVPLETCWKPPTCLLEAGKLRTFLVCRLGVKSNREFSLEAFANFFCCHWRWNDSDWKRSVISSLISRLKGMRVLDLHGLDIPMIPKNIQKLKHLRYLDLSDNCSIQKLPKGITRLHNLQTLKLNRCKSLTELPRDINKLVSLRHLELNDCWSLSHMPHGLGQLTSLQTLPYFILGPRKSDSARLSEFGDLNNLRGSLLIDGLEHMRSDAEEVMSGKLLMKPHLQDLKLRWSNRIEDDMGGEEEVVGKDEMILQGLQPHHTIKALCIWGFCGSKLPDWIGCLSSLHRLEINYCKALISLPEGIGNLPSLQNLRIFGCKVLTSLPESIGQLSLLSELHICDCNGLMSLPESLCNLSSLKTLRIESCELLPSLPESIGQLSLLQELCIYGCNGLTSLPESIGQLSLLPELHIYECNSLMSLPESICNLSSLRTMRIEVCTLLPLLPTSIGQLSLLRELHIYACKGLTSLPKSIGQLSLLQEISIYNCKGLTSLPESVGNLSSLRILRIEVCALLSSLPESIGQLSLLQELHIYNCNGFASLPKSIGQLSLLQELHIYDCNGLTSLPESTGQLSLLRELRIDRCNGLTSLPESIGNLSSLRTLSVEVCALLPSLPESIGQLSLLQELRIYNCNGLTSLPESIGQLSLQELRIYHCNGLTSLPEAICNLSSLWTLRIVVCPVLPSLPESIGQLSLLQELCIFNCNGLTLLPESIGQLSLLQRFFIGSCYGLTSLPEGIQNLRSLQELRIHDCPQLKERCKKEKGDDWPKIAHIPRVDVL